MEGKLLQKVIAFVLVLCLTATNFIFVATSTVYAITADAELEGGNIVFKAYFKEGDSQVTSKTASISEGATLYLSLDLKAGKLEDGKIKIDNANFKMENVDSKYARVNAEEKEIILNDIDYTDTEKGAIEIALPVTFEEEEKIPTSYFSMENRITLSGKYTNSSEKSISSEPIKTTLTWTELDDIELTYSPAVEKIIYLDNATLVQVSVSSNYKDKYFPKETETVSINVPKVDDVIPSYTVLVNGNKIDNAEIVAPVNSQEISYTNNFVKNDEIVWNKSGDVYKVIYLYDGITKLGEPLDFTATVQKKLFNRDMGEKKTVTVSSNVPKGNIATAYAKSLSADVYKGYMYANVGETEYSETYKMEISYVDEVTPTLEFAEDSFETENGKISTNNKTVYKDLEISKDGLKRILGTKGNVTITLDNDITKTIDSTTSDKDGIISVDTENSHSLKLVVKNAENEGELEITANKAIQGNANYEKQVLNAIKSVETIIKSYSLNGESASEASAKTELKETVTEATLSVNNESKENIFSTTNLNKVEFLATLKTGTMDTDLLKSPTVKITLPAEVTEANITSVSALYAEEELTVSSAEVIEENGEKVIVVKLDGEQLSYDNKFIEGIKLTINTEITLNDMATSRDASITMKYTNENSINKEYETTQDVSIQAPYGLITKSNIEANFEVEKPTEKFEATIINNYGKDVENISIVGTIPTKESKENFESEIKDSFEATFSIDTAIKKELGDIIEIKYSKDGESWDSDYEDAKYYKLEITNNKLAAGERLDISYKFDISQVQTNFKVAYTYDGTLKADKLKPSTTVKGTPKVEEDPTQEEPEQEEPNEEEPKTPEVVEEENEKLSAKMAATIGSNKLKDGENVYEGQAIRYTVQIKNNTSEDIENVKLVGNHENANIFEFVTIQQMNTAKSDEMKDFTTQQEAEGKSVKEENIGTIKANGTVTVSYQIRVKENVETLKNKITITADDVDDIKIESENAVKAAELKLEISNNRAKEYPVSKDMVVPNVIKVTNISDKDKENIMVTVKIPEEFTLFRVTGEDNNDNFEILSQENNTLVLKINKITAGVAEEILVLLQVKESNPSRSTVQVNFFATLNDVTYISNEVPIGIKEYVSTEMKAEQTTNIKGDTVQTGDKLIFTISIENISDVEDQIMVTDYVPDAAEVKKVYYIQDGKTTEIADVEDNQVVEVINVKAGEKVEVVIETEVNEELTGKEEIENYATIAGTFLEDEIKTNTVTYKLQSNIKSESSKEDEEESESEKGSAIDGTINEDEDEDKTEIEGTVNVKSSISGLVWLDENKDGIRQSSEKLLSGIKVSLADSTEGKFVQDENGKKLEVTTDNKGEYVFENLERGKYIVVFTYDNTKYRNTEYQSKKATKETNSDIITTKIDSKEDTLKYGLTDTLELSEESIENIDAGLVENEIFDLSLNKYVTKLTVQNSAGTTVKQYNKEQLAKLEINSKVIAGSTVLVEYTMEVKNEGELAGYVNEIIDYIPSDLTFSSEINKDWYVSTDGNLHTAALSNTIINPGETKTITLTLVKRMTDSNAGVTINKAEIAKSSNEYSIPDIDSKAGNEKQGEDDMSTAEVIISINTGIAYTIGIIVGILAITATGITVIYMKRRKEASHE